MASPTEYSLDITGEVCPMTFVKTKLKIEAMAPGDVLILRLKGAEPLENVPRSLGEEGHTILSLEPENGPDPAVHILRVRKR
ncbi:MAG TPA: sulfurtransferase TusA family protein [Alphaproteobacteria bacterium]|nr:sulfurtransferase TusA family protein [Alphaproteobacteria bacterium]